MNNDLISRSEIIEEFYKRVGGDLMVDDIEYIEKIINDMPIVYDLDGVVKKLNELIEESEHESSGANHLAMVRNLAYREALEIIKTGVIK